MDGSPDTAAYIPLNERIVDLETDMFKGKLLLSVRGAPNTAAATKPGGALSCSRRMFHVAVQVGGWGGFNVLLQQILRFRGLCVQASAAGAKWPVTLTNAKFPPAEAKMQQQCHKPA